MYTVRWLFEAKIYGLTDMEDKIFYIGCTTMKPVERLRLHVNKTKMYDSWSNNRKDQKIRSLDHKIKMVVLHSFGVFGIDKREAAKFASIEEERWIKKYLEAGVELVNCTDWKKHRKKGSKKVA